METPLKQLVLLCVSIVLTAQSLLAINLSNPNKTEHSLTTENVGFLFETENLSSSFSNPITLDSINYTIEAKLTDSYGNVANQQDVDVISVCNFQNLSIEVSDLDNVITNISWIDENNIEVSNEFTLNFDSCISAIYRIEISANNTTLFDTVEINCTDINIEVQELSNPGSGSGIIDINSDGYLDFCEGDYTSLRINNLDEAQNLAYHWIGTNGFIHADDKTSNPSFYGLNQGNFSVLLKTTNQFGCQRRDQFGFSINNISNLEIQTTIINDIDTIIYTEINDSTIYNCYPNATLILSHTGVSTNGNVFVQWFDDNKNLLGNEPSLQVSTTENITYSVVVTDEFGCSNTKSINVIGNPVSTNIIELENGTELVDLDEDGDLDLCLDFSNPLLVINNNPDDNLIYEWSGDIITDGLDTPNPILTPPSAGNYSIRLVVTNQFGCTQEHELDLVLYDFNSANDIKINKDCVTGVVDFEFDQANFSFYTWLFTDENEVAYLSNENPATFTYSVSGNYTIELIPNENLCELEKITKDIEITIPNSDLEISLQYLACTEDELTIQLNTPLQSEVDSIVNQVWIFGSGSGSFSESPIITIKEPDTFLVETNFETVNGCIFDISKSFNFSFMDTEFIQDTIIACHDAVDLELNPNSDSSIVYEWSPNPFFNQLDVTNPTIDVLADYIFNVNLSQDINDVNCTAEKSITLLVEEELTSNVILADSKVKIVEQDNQLLKIYQCLPFQNFQLIGNFIDGNNYEWSNNYSFDVESQLSTDQILEVTNEMIESGNLYFRYENNGCYSNVFEIEFKSIQDPIATLAFDYMPNSDCEPSILSLSANVSTPLSEVDSYQWMGPNGFASNQRSPKINTTGNENGIYYLTITNLAGCSSTTNIEVNGILPPKLSDPKINTNSSVCEGEEYVLTVEQDLEAEYIWSFPSPVGIIGQGTNTLTIRSLDESFHLGTYTVQKIKDDCISNMDTFILDSSVALKLSDDPLCQGQNLVLEVNAPYGVGFVWIGPDNFYSTAKKPIIFGVTEQNNGIYNVEVQSINGCITKKEFEINNIFSALSKPDIIVTGPTCFGDPIILSTNLVEEEYTWIGPLGTDTDLKTLDAKIVIHENDLSYQSGSWKVLITDQNGCNAISDPVSVGINDVPVASIQGDEILCEGDIIKLYAQEVVGGNYEWYDQAPTGRNAISDNQSIEIINIDPGFYTYYLRVTANDCPSEWVEKTVRVKEKPSAQLLANFESSADCLDFHLNLNSNVSGEAPFEYLWIGPENYLSTEPEPSLLEFTSEQLGTYTLELSDNTGCTSSMHSLEVVEIPQVPELPIFEFTGGPCSGEEVEIRITNYEGLENQVTWNIPTYDSVVTSTNENSITITNLKDIHVGMYSASIQLESCTLSSDPFEIELNPNPSIAFEVDEGIICDGGDLVISTQVSNAIDYQWIGPAGFTSTEANINIPKATQLNNGLYTLTVNTVDGCSSTREIFISNIALPLVVPTLKVNTICNGSNIELFTDFEGEFYKWISPIGETNDLETSINTLSISSDNIYYLSGEWSVMVTDENGCSNISQPLMVSFETNNINIEDNQIEGRKCIQEQVQLESPFFEGATYNWTGPNGFTSNQQNPQILINEDDQINGDYVLTVIESSGCETNSITNVNLDNGIDAPILFIEENTYCKGDDFTIYTTSYQGEEISYKWIFPNQSNIENALTESNKLVIENSNSENEGNYALAVYVDGCLSYSSEDIYININDNPDVALIESQNVCMNGELILATEALSGQAPFEYNWSGPLGYISTDSTPNLVDLSFEMSGVYTLEVLDANRCGSGMASTKVEVLEVPETPIIESNSLAYCVGQDIELSIVNWVDGQIYHWTLADGSQYDSSEPKLIIENAKIGIDDGFYSVGTVNGSCNSLPSAEYLVSIIEAPNLSEISNTSVGSLVCVGEAIQLIAPFFEGVNYYWSGPNNFESQEQMPSIENVSINDNGLYTLYVEVGNCISTIASTNVEVLESPQTPIVESNSLANCVGQDIELSIVNWIDGQTYQWTLADGSHYDSSEPNLIIENAQIGIDDGFYSLASLDGACSSVASAEYLVSIIEAPNLSEISNTSVGSLVCVGEAIQLTAPFFEGANYYWSGPNNFESQEQMPLIENVSPNNNGLYTLYVEIETCTSNMASTSVEVLELPETPIIESNSLIYCLGEDIELSIENWTEGQIYHWTLVDGSLYQSTESNLIIESAQVGVDDGFYSVSAIDGTCNSLPSSEYEVNIVEVPSLSEISNTSIDTVVCEGESLQLTAPFFDGASYYWLGPNDFASREQTPSFETVDIDDNGLYTLYVEIDNCVSAIAETVVDIKLKPVEPTIAENEIFCENSDAILEVVNPDPELIYDWYRASSNSKVGEGFSLNIPNVDDSNTGLYYTIARSDFCASEASETTYLAVEFLINSTAYAGEDTIVCSPEFLLGQHPINDKEGFWTSLDESSQPIIIDEYNYQTLVAELNLGHNPFAWELTNAICQNKVVDTINVVYLPYPLANDDNYSTKMNTSYADNVIDNDLLNSTDYTTSIVEGSIHGELELSDTGNFVYTPDLNFIGTDFFTYQLCNDECPEDCFQAKVSIEIGTESECFVPSIFTPNGDGNNDNFIIPFLTQYSNNEIVIFNRWGDQVFHSDNYQDEWDGTFEGKSLPSGTYYYILNVNDAERTVKVGYVFIQR